MTLTLTDLDTEARDLVLSRFDESDALRLGQILIDLAKGLPVVINIRNAHRCFFHAALPGSAAKNDNWARRKSNTTLMTGLASMAVGLKNAEQGQTLARDGMAEADHADHGGAVPVVVAGVGMVAVATVSGLPQRDDHALVVRGLRALMAAT